MESKALKEKLFNTKIYIMKQKIIFIRTATSIGGAEITTKLISEELSKYFKIYNFQHPYKLQTQNTKMIEGETLLEPGSSIKDYFKLHLLYFKYKGKYTQLVNKILQTNINTVIIESFSDKIILTNIINKIAPKIKVLWWEHGPITNTRWLKYSPHLKYLYLKNSRYVNKIVAVSKATRDDLKKMSIPTNKISVIYPITRVKKIGTKIPHKHFTIGFMSRIEKEKGIYELLQAAIILKNKPIKFIIAGKGTEENKVSKYIIDNNLQKNVKFVGFQKEIDPILQKINITILPSSHEGLPLTLMESLKARIPIMGTHAGGIPEILHNKVNGIFIDKNAQDIADKIKTLYKNRTLYNKLQKNTLKSINTFSSETIIRKWKYII